MSVETAEGSIDSVTIYRLQTRGITAYLTNESIVVPTDASGLNGNFSAATGRFIVLDGTTVATGVVFSLGQVPTGLSIVIDAATGEYSVSTLTTDSANAVLIASFNGLSIPRGITVAKAKKGVTGTPGIQGPQGESARDWQSKSTILHSLSPMRAMYIFMDSILPAVLPTLVDIVMFEGQKISVDPVFVSPRECLMDSLSFIHTVMRCLRDTFQLR